MIHEVMTLIPGSQFELLSQKFQTVHACKFAFAYS